jgi:hydroxymethylbilane synthase
MADRLPGDSAEIERAVAAMDDPRARIEVSAERAFLDEIGASCASPIGVRATAEDGRLALRALLFSLDGSRSMTDSLSIAQSSGIADAERAGIELARRMLDRGAAELIGDTK